MPKQVPPQPNLTPAAQLDEYYMQAALREALAAADDDEVPIGAVVVWERKIIGKGHNAVERLQDATAHAEILALTAAMNHLGAKYLPDCTLYVSLEPCPMCAGAIRLAQLSRVVYGAADPKGGYTCFAHHIIPDRTAVVKDVLAAESSLLLKEFFRQKRALQ